MDNNNFVFNSKSDYQNIVDILSKPLIKYFSKGKAAMMPGATAANYSNRSMNLEGFSRPLWGLVPFWAGSNYNNFKNIYIEGLRNGSNPEHPEYWGPEDNCSQNFVEMAPISLGLILTPEVVWDPLTELEKNNLNDWLLSINEYDVYDNNWLFFRVLVNIGLRCVGGRFDKNALDKATQRLDEFYIGDGWYRDGYSTQLDYYVAFSMHFYSLIYAKVMMKDEPNRCIEYIKRSKLFAEDYIYWFSKNGAAIPYGRSLTYRFAQCCFWGALAFTDTEVFSWGIMKGIINRHFRDWFNKKILDGENILTIGYAYPNLNMSEEYNAPGSPYWCFKSFIILALPDNHKFWTAQEQPLPDLKSVKLLKHPKMIIQHLHNENVVALTSGQYANFEPTHVAEKYSKFAYSTAFGFNIPRSYYRIEETAPDNMLAFFKNHMFFIRRRCHTVKIDENSNTLYSAWSPIDGVIVETTLTPTVTGHLRIHVVHSSYAITAFECGFSLPYDQKDNVQVNKNNNGIALSTFWGSSQLIILEGDAFIEVAFCNPNVNLLHPRIMLPYAKFNIKKGKTLIKSEIIGKKN